MGLDESVFVQYLKYLQGLLHLDLGTSYSFQAPAFDVVLSRLPYTITLATAAILLTTAGVDPAGRVDGPPRRHPPRTRPPTS